MSRSAKNWPLQERRHWMWFVFPQFKALGRRAMAKHFGIESKDEALAY